MHSNNTLPIMIIGAGLGGTALLDIFLLEENIEIVGIVDPNPEAMGVGIARGKGIEVFANVESALQKAGQCMVFNMTNDPEMDELLIRHTGISGVIGGNAAKFFWHVISRLQSIKCELLEDLARMKAVIQNVREGIISITPGGVIEAANPAIEQIFGYCQKELIGQSIEALFPQQHDSLIDKFLLDAEKASFGSARTEITAVHKDGNQFPIEISIADMSLGSRKCFVAMVRDITERKDAEGRLTRLALYDTLTGLPNRTNFFGKLEFSLAHARRNKLVVALLFIDLDGFKAVNDHMGHAAGDYLLKTVAQRLQSYIRESDTAARMGGDEFTIILNNLKSPGEAKLVAQKLIKALSEDVEYGDETISHIGASIGIAVFPDHSQTEDGLINEADSAMYRAKAAGKNCYVMSS